MIIPPFTLQREETPKSAAFVQRTFVTVASATMKFAIRKLAVVATVAGLLCATSAGVAEEAVNIGVAIPAATHSFTAGIVFWANEAKKDLEKAHPGLKIMVKTAGSAPEQANQLKTC